MPPPQAIAIGHPPASLLHIDLDTPLSDLDVSIRLANEPTAAALYLTHAQACRLFDHHDRPLCHAILMVHIRGFISHQYAANTNLEIQRAHPDDLAYIMPDITIAGQPFTEAAFHWELVNARNHMHAGVEILLSNNFSRLPPPPPPVPPAPRDSPTLDPIADSTPAALDSNQGRDVYPDLAPTLAVNQGRVDHATIHSSNAPTSIVAAANVDPGPRPSVPVVNQLPDDDPPRMSTRRTKAQGNLPKVHELTKHQRNQLRKLSGMSIKTDTQVLVETIGDLLTPTNLDLDANSVTHPT